MGDGRPNSVPDRFAVWRRLATGRHPHATWGGVASPGVSDSSDPRHRLGALGERLASEHLVRRGFQILERNYRTRWGELDIVAFNGHTLAFCEVKTRRIGQAQRTPFESIHRRKQGRVRKMAGSWLRERPLRPSAVVIRCDAIAVTFDCAGQLVAIDHLEGAF